MNIPIRRIREDFDRIALLTEQHGDTGGIYHRFLLRHLPSRCEDALEVGCGTGAFTRLLAARSRRTTAIDLSPRMIRLAEQQSACHPNIEYVLGDVMQLSLPAERYDCVVSLATLHHLPLHQALPKMKAALKPGGTLIIHDLIADSGLVDKLRGALAYAVGAARRFQMTGRIRMPRELRQAWTEHGRAETYLSLREVREMCEQHLPGARVRRHLLWRYTVIWRRSNIGAVSV
jgi:SAM-dependent methyltransferase